MEENQKLSKRIGDFIVKTLSGMAYGLFATLIVGTIFSGFFGKLFSFGKANDFCLAMSNILNVTGTTLQYITGAGIGVGIALILKFDALKTITLAAAGEIAAVFSLSAKGFIEHGTFPESAFAKVILDPKTATPFSIGQVGDPLTIYLVVIAVALLIKFVLRKKTAVDILIVPLFGVAVALLATFALRVPAIFVTYGIQWVINEGTKAVPILAGIVVAVLMGMALTAPISSAAIGAMVFTSSLIGAEGNEGLTIASGAAIVGCCCQMVGFAIQSRKSNSVGMVISIGIGTSMLQFTNIVKKPLIWLPTIIASAILGGVVAGCYDWIGMVCDGANAGMGTAGFVGQIGTIMKMGVDNWKTWVFVPLFQIILPIALVFGLDLLFKKIKLYSDQDLAVEKK